ncbi:hypothetical protein AIOL_003528 [Candidatus Rhodobacter oscarellae]|uniref:Glycosyltransferase n=1 Tax=Candidatus Rhodobacter oscarellae TaxID=1675527 RepID=A0A0J9E766_9RHOB|nr:glycosyltransferase family 2 protein [Candidatus Rhodobacter lobularis]KMW58551.1 hypothetical protein AIOL_003528 [Candidatus Rhodobacter lobularis]
MSSSKSPLAILTMVRGDHHWARKWIAHYRQHVERLKDIYVIIHGEDEELEQIFAGCSVMSVPLRGTGLENFERRRLDCEHFLIRGLQAYFQCVLMVDIDEFVMPAPGDGRALAEFLADRHDGEMVRSALGFEVLHGLEEDEAPLDLAQPVLGQRPWVYCNAQYSKPCAFYFNFGGATHHRVWGAPWVIDPDLLLFHLRYCDRDLLDRYVATRKAYYGEQEEAGAASSGSWRRPWKEYVGILREVEARPRGDLTPETRAALKSQILTDFARTNKVGKIASGPLRLPTEFGALL